MNLPTNHEEESTNSRQPRKTIEIDQDNLLLVTEKICNHTRYPYLTLRIFLHVLSGMEANGQIHISARQLARKMGAHYDTVSKSIKLLRNLRVLSKD